MNKYIHLLGAFLITNTASFSATPIDRTELKAFWADHGNTGKERYLYSDPDGPQRCLDSKDYQLTIEEINRAAFEKIGDTQMLYVGGTAGLYRDGVFGLAHPFDLFRSDSRTSDFLPLQDYDLSKVSQYSQFIFMHNMPGSWITQPLPNSKDVLKIPGRCLNRVIFRKIIIDPRIIEYVKKEELKILYNSLRPGGHLFIPMTRKTISSAEYEIQFSTKDSDRFSEIKELLGTPAEEGKNILFPYHPSEVREIFDTDSEYKPGISLYIPPENTASISPYKLTTRFHFQAFNKPADFIQKIQNDVNPIYFRNHSSINYIADFIQKIQNDVNPTYFRDHSSINYIVVNKR